MLKSEIYSYDGTIDQWNKVQYAFRTSAEILKDENPPVAIYPGWEGGWRSGWFRRSRFRWKGVRKLRTSRQVALLLELWCNAELFGTSPWKTTLSMQKGLTNALFLAFLKWGFIALTDVNCNLSWPWRARSSTKVLTRWRWGWMGGGDIFERPEKVVNLSIGTFVRKSCEKQWHTHTHKILIHYSCCVSKKRQYFPEINRFFWHYT